MLTTYLSVDIETTGLDPRMDKIIQIGALRVRDGEVTDTFRTYVNPGRKISERITELTGIRDKTVADAPVIGDVLPEFLTFAGEEVLLGHHVIFDYSFLKRAAVNEGYPFERQGMDTLKIARRFLPELESRSLPFLCKHYGISHRAHDALADARATMELYHRLCQDFPVDAKYKPEQLIYKVKKETPVTQRQKERLYALIDKHKLDVDYNVEMLTRNEASRFTDKILAEYGR